MDGALLSTESNAGRAATFVSAELCRLHCGLLALYGILFSFGRCPNLANTSHFLCSLAILQNLPPSEGKNRRPRFGLTNGKRIRQSNAASEEEVFGGPIHRRSVGECRARIWVSIGEFKPWYAEKLCQPTLRQAKFMCSCHHWWGATSFLFAAACLGLAH